MFYVLLMTCCQGLAALSGQHGQMVVGRVGWGPSHFTQCQQGQRLLDSMLQVGCHWSTPVT